jgi:RNA polymerase sigma-70 factor (ECF subfamily)
MVGLWALDRPSRAKRRHERVVSARFEKPPSPVRALRSAHGVVRSLPFEGDEAELVAAMARGRLDAGAAFYDRHVHAIHALVFRLMGPDGELDDVVHDVFVRALESLPRLREPAALRSWLFGIAVRTVAIRFQKRTRQRWLRFMAPEDVPEVGTASLSVTSELGESLREVYAILRGMDADERIALVLHRVEGLAHEDAARAAGTSVATFRRRLARGEAKFLARAKARPALVSWLAPADAPVAHTPGDAS